MSGVVRPPCPALRPFVRSLGCVGGILPPGRERILPTATVSLMVNLHEDEFRTYDAPEAPAAERTAGAVLAGPRSRHVVIDAEEQRSLVEVTFELGGALPLFGVPMSAVRDQLVELEALWGRDGRLLRERLLEVATAQQRLSLVEAVLCARLAGQPKPNPLLAGAAAAFERGLPVAAVADEVGMLQRRFTRHFTESVGLTPKRYSRVRRLQRVLGAVQAGVADSWAEVAATHGFADQAHLVNDFRELTGVTPTAYRSRSAAERNHVPTAAH
jgi:AraC-like DNA-binding protein